MIKPRNYMVAGGVDLYDRFGFAMTDSFTMDPPRAKRYTVDVLGGDGVIDLTESLAGDASFENRSMAVELLWTGDGDLDGVAFERAKTALCNFLHGRTLDFWMSRDPEYTYTGFFEVDSYRPVMDRGVVSLAIDAHPYKLREHVVARVASGGGRRAHLACGRKRQRPTIECSCECTVKVGDESMVLQPGSWRVPGLVLTEGDNEVFVAAVMGDGDRTVADLSDRTIAALGEASVAELSWKSAPPDVEQRAVYFSYDIMDL